jgi:hypothetical protein
MVGILKYKIIRVAAFLALADSVFQHIDRAVPFLARFLAFMPD